MYVCKYVLYIHIYVYVYILQPFDLSLPDAEA